MHKLQKRLTPGAKLAVVEIRTNASTGGFDKRAILLLNGSFEDAGLPFAQVDRWSLTVTNSAVAGPSSELVSQLKGKYEIIVALGSEATKKLCKTKRTLDDYAGSLTWSADLESWVLPTWHPSVVYVGDKKTLNKRYDQFDILYDHIIRAVQLAKGERKFPSKNHEDDLPPTTFVGHNGTRNPDNTWSGYWECTDEEAAEAKAYFTHWLDFLDSGDPVLLPHAFAIDTESCNLNIFRPNGFLMFQVYDGSDAYAFNAGVVLDPRVKPYITRFLSHPLARWRLWNTKYDRQVIKHNFGVSLGDRDVCGLALSMGITEKGKQCGLKYRSRQDLNAPFYEEALDEWFVYPPDLSATEKKRHKNYGHIRPDVMATYGCADTYYTYEEIPLLVQRVREEGTLKSVRDLLVPAQRVLADVEYQGIRVDLDYAQTTSAAWEPKINDAIRAVQEYAKSVGFPSPDSGIGTPYKTVCECVPVRARFHLEGARVLSYRKLLRDAGFDLNDCIRCDNKRYVTEMDRTLNVNSSKQMQHLCYDILRMKELPHEEDPTTNKFFWKLNANHPLAKLVAEYKELQYLRRNFLEGIQRFVAEDGKVHPDFLLFGTKTGRLAIHSPAAQTIPQHGENAKAAKRLFVPSNEEYLIVNVDYKSLEMFMAHHLTGDPKLLENLTGEWDIHTALAAVVYGKDPADVSKEERQSVKSVNFGAGYGISGFKLALDPAMEQATGGDPDVAQQFIDAFWNLYSVWASKCDEWRLQANTDQFLTTEMGRKRRWNLITRDNQNKVNNQAINFPGQSMASDLCLSSLIRLHPALQERGWGGVLLTVHDSLVFEIKREHLHESVALIEREMTTPPFETTTPFAVDIEVGLNYGEKEPYDPEKDYVNDL
jgi:DNA polymerase I-like protein with 3'-5' exonuclease and polymerase domains